MLIKEVIFKDVKFMSAEEKSKVLKQWKRFISTLANAIGNDKGSTALFDCFTDRLYKHLHLHCSFIAHYDRQGYFESYFADSENTIRFIKQFDSDFGCVSFEYGGNYWLTSEDYRDINEAMCRVVNEHKAGIYEKAGKLIVERDLIEAKRLAEKCGYKVVKMEMK